MGIMRRFLILAIVAVAFAACGNKTKGADADAVADGDSTVVNEEQVDTVPMPMFVVGMEGKYMQMLYWTGLKEPKKTKDNEEYFDDIHDNWALQDMFRRNRAQYSNLVNGDNVVKITYVDEVLKDPDGNTPSMGELHGREGIPSLCARYTCQASKKNSRGVVIVTDEYLKSRKSLKIKGHDIYGGTLKKLPATIVKQLEDKYGMKASRSVLAATIGDKYSWGAVQFKGEYKKAKDKDGKHVLALNVLTDGKQVWTCEEIGYYESDGSFGWNVDDEGEYIPCDIAAAFEGPKGLELCYTHSAPESEEIGLFCTVDGALKQQTYAIYHRMIDEEIPVWKKDFAMMDKMYHAHEQSDKYVKLTKWSHCYIDGDNEWIWLTDKDEKNGAFFIRKDGKFRLVSVQNKSLQPSTCSKDGYSYLKMEGTAGGPSWQTVVYAFKDGKQVWEFFCLEVYGEIDECMLNKKQMSKEEGRIFKDKIPEGEKINAYFRDINEKQ